MIVLELVVICLLVFSLITAPNLTQEVSDLKEQLVLYESGYSGLLLSYNGLMDKHNKVIVETNEFIEMCNDFNKLCNERIIKANNQLRECGFV